MKEYKKVTLNVCNYCGFQALFIKDMKNHLKKNHLLIRKLKVNRIETIIPLYKKAVKHSLRMLKTKQHNSKSVEGKQ